MVRGLRIMRILRSTLIGFSDEREPEHRMLAASDQAQPPVLRLGERLSKRQADTGATAPGAPPLEDVQRVIDTDSFVTDIDDDAAVQRSGDDGDGDSSMFDRVFDENVEDLAKSARRRSWRSPNVCGTGDAHPRALIRSVGARHPRP